MRPLITGSAIGMFLISTLAWFWSGLPGRDFSILVRAVFEISVRNQIQGWQANFIPLFLFIFCSGLFLGVLQVRRDFEPEANNFIGHIWSILDFILSLFASLLPLTLSAVISTLIGLGVSDFIPTKDNILISFIGAFWGIVFSYLLRLVGFNIGKSLIPVRWWTKTTTMTGRRYILWGEWVERNRTQWFADTSASLLCSFTAVTVAAIFGSVWIVAEQIFLETHTFINTPDAGQVNGHNDAQDSNRNQPIDSTNSIFSILSALIIGFLGSPVLSGFISILSLLLSIIWRNEDKQRSGQAT